MKKRLFCIFAALLMLLSLSVPAAADAPVLIGDQVDAFSADELAELSAKAQKICDDYGVAAAIVISPDCGGARVNEYAESYFGDGGFPADCILLVVNEEAGEYCFCSTGRAQDLFGDAARSELWNAYAGPETYYDAVWDYLGAAETVLAGGETVIAPAVSSEAVSSAASSEAEAGGLLPYFADDMGALDDGELDELNAYAANLAAAYETGVCAVIAEDLGGKTPEQYGEEYIKANGLLPDGVMIVADGASGEAGIAAFGKAKEIFGSDGLDALLAAFKAPGDIYQGCSAYVDKFTELYGAHLAAAAGSGQQSQTQTPQEAEKAPLLVDDADLLSDGEEKELLSKLTEISERQKCDVVILTTNDLGGEDIKNCAADIYDALGYGYGDSHDGVLLLVYINGGDRKRQMITTGFGITAFTDAGIGYILDKTRPDMSAGNYAAAFGSYAALCDEFITRARTGKPYDTGSMPKGKFNAFGAAVVALLVGAAFAFVMLLIEKGKCRNVHAKSAAADYMRPGSLSVTGGDDLFLYSNVTRTERPREHSSGGSSTFTGSSGTTHGGGGDSF